MSNSISNNSDKPTHLDNKLPTGPTLLPQKSANMLKSEILKLTIPVLDGIGHKVPGILHRPLKGRAVGSAAILVSGAGGGLSGPMGMYISLATKLANAGVHALRLDYRIPNETEYCVSDIKASMQWLEKNEGSKKFALLGWSFGSSPVITVGSQEKEKTFGVATIAAQTAGTKGIRTLSPIPILLLHGTGDKCLTPRCSESLFSQYNGSNKDIVLYPDDDHSLSKNIFKAESKLFEFFSNVLGSLNESSTENEYTSLIGSKEEGIKLMKQGHDLQGGEKMI